MLPELLDYFRNSSPKILKDLGYVYSSIALERRARRQTKDWAEHIQNCHDLWRQVLENQNYEKILVLGSGPLTEIPMDYVLENCGELHLVDIVQPRKVKKLWGHHDKVFLHESDVTGVVNWVKALKEPSTLDFKAPISSLKADLVVSANLLSQLSLEPSWYLTKKLKVPQESLFMKELIAKLSAEHLEHLGTYGARKVVLYTDLKRDYISPAGEKLESHPSRVLADQDLGQKIKEWRWRLCPLGEESDDYEIEMLMAAFVMASSTASVHS